MLNVLIVTYHPIYPMKTGASVAQFGMIESLSGLCNLSLAIPENYYPNDSDLAQLIKRIPRIKTYCLPSRSGNLRVSGLRSFLGFAKKNLIGFLNAFENLITPPPTDIELSDNLKIDAIESFRGIYQHSPLLLFHNEHWIEVIRNIIDSDKIDVVQVEFSENANLVAALPSHVKKVFINHECYSDRLKSHISALSLKSDFLDYFYSLNRFLEASILTQYDAVVSFGSQDDEKLQEMLSSYISKPSCFVAPYAIPESEFRSLDDNLPDIKKLVFVGPETHFPNKDAVEWFIDNVATEALERFGLRLYIIGVWEQETISRYSSHPSQVKFLGYVDDLYRHSRGAINISPVRIGSGLRTKTMIAMAQGIPVIATKFSLTGLEATHLQNVLVADTPSEFLWCIQYLIDNSCNTLRMRENAQNLMRNEYSQGILADNRILLYNSLMKAK